MVRTTSEVPPWRQASLRMASVMISRGRGLIAGSPGATGSPALVTVPTPSPARKRTPLPALPAVTATTTSAPWVTSGSSPASLITEARASPVSRWCDASGNPASLPPGRVIVTGSGNVPVISASYAAAAAAAAQAPVVHPLRKASFAMSPAAPDIGLGNIVSRGGEFARKCGYGTSCRTIVARGE